jgi:hypothetical protein
MPLIELQRELNWKLNCIRAVVRVRREGGRRRDAQYSTIID